MMGKYTLDFKLAAIRSHEQGNKIGQVARQFGVDKGAVREWVASYKKHGIEGIKPLSGPRCYSSEFKESVVCYMQKHGLSAKHTATHFNLRTSATVTNWVQRYNQGGKQALESKRKGRQSTMSKSPKEPLVSSADKHKSQEQLLRELVYLRTENAYLKKLQALVLEKQVLVKKPVSSRD